MAILGSTAGKIVLAATVTGIVCLGLYAYSYSENIRVMQTGYWLFSGYSSSMLVFVTACISVFYNAILIISSLFNDSTSAVLHSTYFFASHVISALLYLSGAIADISNDNIRKYGYDALKAGIAFAVFSGVLHALAAFFIKKGN